MKKALISILIILSLILTMLSCKEPVDTDTDTDTEGNEEQAIQPIYLSKQYYAELLCGEYTGSELKIFDEEGASYYKIFTSAEELIVNTTSGNGISNIGNIFEDYYVVMIASVDFSGDFNPNEKIGYKRISNEKGRLGIVLDKRNIRESEMSDGEPSCIVPIVRYDYVQVPQSALKSFLRVNESYGRINLLVQKFEYILPTDILALDNDLIAGRVYIIQGEDFESWASTHFINAKEYGFESTEDEVVICYSLKSPYYGKSRYSSYAIYGGTLTVEREVSSCDAGYTRPFVELLKLPKEELAKVSTVTFNDTVIKIDVIKPMYNAVVKSELTGKENIGYMATKDFGYYYGTDLTDNSGAYSRMIQSYSELVELVEFPEIVEESFFDNNNILALKINSNKNIASYYIGFTEYEASSRAVNITMVGKNMAVDNTEELYPDGLSSQYHYLCYIVVPKGENYQKNLSVRLSLKTLNDDFQIISNIENGIRHADGTAWLLNGSEEIRNFELIYDININRTYGSLFAVYIQNSNNVNSLQGYENLCIHGKAITLNLINKVEELGFEGGASSGAPCFIIIPVTDSNIINSYNLELYTKIKDYGNYNTDEVIKREDAIYESGYGRGLSLKSMYGVSFKIITSEAEYEIYKAARNAQEQNAGLSHVNHYPEVDFESYDVILIDNTLRYDNKIDLVYKNARIYEDVLYLHREAVIDYEEILWQENNVNTIVEYVIVPKDVMAEKEINQIKVVNSEQYNFDWEIIPDPELGIPEIMEDREIIIL